MLRSERHVALNPADTAASSGRAAATMALITSGGRSVNLARELLVTTMMLDSRCLCRQGHYSVPGFVLLVLFIIRVSLLPTHHGALERSACAHAVDLVCQFVH